jgi:multiple sugar transport system permease protein
MSNAMEGLPYAVGSRKKGVAPSERIRLWVRLLIYLLLCGFGVFMVLPFFWMVMTSFKTLPEAFHMPPKWIPSVFQWQNYPNVLVGFHFVRYSLNTLFRATSVTLIQIFICSLSAYAFARLRFPGRNVLFILYLATLMVPSQVTLVPSFLLMKVFGWLGTFWALIIPVAFGGTTFGIFMLRQFFLSIPTDLTDASKIDGCSPFGTYIRVLLPLARTALITFGVIAFLGTWNDLLWPIVVANQESIRVLGAALSTFQGQNWTHIEFVMAAATLSVLPVFIVYVVAQRYIIEGFTLSGMGGV